ncbi:hypothetical protein SISNIDRAFT_498877 [Sistotremastrum niveocremeum HHB9708]|uniref:Uncharacterized protein n=1 Tax=Sistotremastrum niveocremeum HHB9708 TaxID=1314777 RepID=A0A165AB89_9AGAM|nr:hypothetical protein SISNIDRAFT_498877 [Sistotremastrum niveocremeum HHB9708]
MSSDLEALAQIWYKTTGILDRAFRNGGALMCSAFSPPLRLDEKDDWLAVRIFIGSFTGSVIDEQEVTLAEPQVTGGHVGNQNPSIKEPNFGALGAPEVRIQEGISSGGTTVGGQHDNEHNINLNHTPIRHVLFVQQEEQVPGTGITTVPPTPRLVALDLEDDVSDLDLAGPSQAVRGDEGQKKRAVRYVLRVVPCLPDSCTSSASMKANSGSKCHRKDGGPSA